MNQNMAFGDGAEGKLLFFFLPSEKIGCEPRPFTKKTLFDTTSSGRGGGGAISCCATAGLLQQFPGLVSLGYAFIREAGIFCVGVVACGTARDIFLHACVLPLALLLLPPTVHTLFRVAVFPTIVLLAYSCCCVSSCRLVFFFCRKASLASDYRTGEASPEIWRSPVTWRVRLVPPLCSAGRTRWRRPSWISGWTCRKHAILWSSPARWTLTSLLGNKHA